MKNSVETRTEQQMEKNSIVIRHAKGVLMKDGWTKGTMSNGRNQHCVLGAFAAVHGWTPNDFISDGGDGWWVVEEDSVYRHSPAAQAFAACLEWDDEYSDGDDKIINWNDHEDTTIEQVMAALEKCAREEEAAGR